MPLKKKKVNNIVSSTQTINNDNNIIKTIEKIGIDYGQFTTAPTAPTTATATTAAVESEWCY